MHLQLFLRFLQPRTSSTLEEERIIFWPLHSDDEMQDVNCAIDLDRSRVTREPVDSLVSDNL